MQLRDILTMLVRLAADNGLTTPSVCGGVARGKAMQQLLKAAPQQDVSDLDVTTGDATVHQLAKLFTMEMGKSYEVSSQQMNDGHTSVMVGNFKVDFSSNFTDPSVDAALAARGIKHPTALQREMFSRDFTCNALLLSADLKKLRDPTRRGIPDIQARVIRTCLAPQTTFSSNPNRIIRVIYLSAKLDFDVAPEIIQWIGENRQVVRASSDSYLTKNLNKAFAANPTRAIQLLNQTGLWELMPITDEILPFYQRRNEPEMRPQPASKTAQMFSNFDYGVDSKTGPGLSYYSDLTKYKSVADFRKKRRARRRKTIRKFLDTRPDRAGKNK